MSITEQHGNLKVQNLCRWSPLPRTTLKLNSQRNTLCMGISFFFSMEGTKFFSRISFCPLTFQSTTIWYSEYRNINCGTNLFLSHSIINLSILFICITYFICTFLALCSDIQNNIPFQGLTCALFTADRYIITRFPSNHFIITDTICFFLDQLYKML